MKPNFQVDVSRLGKRLNEAWNRSKKQDRKALLYKAGGMVAYGAMVFTPPTPGNRNIGAGSQGRIQWGQHKEAGEKAVTRDLLHFLMPVARENLFASGKTGAGEYLFIDEINGKRYIVSHERNKTGAGLQEINTIHRSLRNRRGRVRKLRVPFRNHVGNVVEVLRFVVSYRTYRAYEKQQHASLGWGKAGFLPILAKFNYRSAVPAWVRKHGGKPGVSAALFKVTETDTKMTVTFANVVDHIQVAAQYSQPVKQAMFYTANAYDRMAAEFAKKTIPQRFREAQRR